MSIIGTVVNGVKRLNTKVKDTMDNIIQDVKDESELDKWQKKLSQSKTSYNPKLMDERELLYSGTPNVDSNINSGAKPSKGANLVGNISFEFIESQVNTSIPQPNVRTKRKGYELQEKMIEDSIINDLKDIGIEEINDYNERTTPVQGYSIIVMDWDTDYKHHLWQGEIKLRHVHPKQLITQNGVYDIKKNEYYFLLSNVTKDYIKRRYNKDVWSESEQFPEVNKLVDGGQTQRDNTLTGLSLVGNARNQNETVTEIVCIYRDEDGDVGKFAWVNDVVLESLPKYYYRRMDECKKCGYQTAQGTGKVCPDCGGKSFKTVTLDTETLDHDVLMADGVTVIPKGTKIPYHIPTQFPIIIRKNVPKQFSFEGQSDVDIMRDQQDSIKKVGTKMEEKMVKGGQLIMLPEGMKQVTISNDTYQVVRGSASDLSQVKIENLTAPITEDLQYLQEQRLNVQQMLGITQSYQGQADNTAISGIAKQRQIQQSAGRLQSKIFNKTTAFKELFELMFHFKLAFYDERRPYVSKDDKGNPFYGEFDRYQFLLRDEAGEYYYNIDFTFSADAGDGLPKDPMFMYQQATEMLAKGAINKVQFWTLMETLNFPNATDIKKQAIQEMQNPPQPPKEIPREVINFADLPIAGKIQQLALIGITVTPQDFMQDLQMQQQANQPVQQQDPSQAHNQAMDVAKMQVAHQAEITRLQAEIAKVQMQHQANAELSAQQGEQRLKEIALKAGVDAQLNEQKVGHSALLNEQTAGHQAVLTQMKPAGGGNNGQG